MPRANVLGVGVHAVNPRSALKIITDAVINRDKGYVCATGVHGVMEAQRSSDLRTIFARALLVVPDGMPTVWMGHLQGLRTMARVFGPDLMLAVMGCPQLHGCSHFLYGGNDGVAEQLRKSLAGHFPHARVVGTYTPPFRELSQEEESHLFKLVDRLRPDIIWVGLSTPKQERFMARYQHRLHTTVVIGVGAAFDFHTGRLRDSPAWVKRVGLQWFHRLLQDPKRLWKRYLINNPRFLVEAALQICGLKEYPLSDACRDFPATLASSDPSPHSQP
jgi:N-acetylglucosaminyldiphosphoundecaprenol N-acetyl-beta-D-mannosaminyltransferase